MPAKKANRLTGWNIMRRLLADAAKPDVPGFYISRSCTYFWETVPYLGRDLKRVKTLTATGRIMARIPCAKAVCACAAKCEW